MISNELINLSKSASGFADIPLSGSMLLKSVDRYDPGYTVIRVSECHPVSSQHELAPQGFGDLVYSISKITNSGGRYMYEG